MIIDEKILNKEMFAKLEKRAANFKPIENNIFDKYRYYQENPRKLANVDDLLTAIGIAYSWMPTMLDIYYKEEKSLQFLIAEIKALGNINSVKKIYKEEEKIKSTLEKLSRATNNSVVGASKVLHLFYPVNIPIFDSRVRKAWNKLFGAKMKMPVLNSKNQINCYFQYWYAVLYWKEQLMQPKVRMIEKQLFLYGGYLVDIERIKRKQKTNNEI